MVYMGVPARYIGSFEDFVNKRKMCEMVEVKKQKGELREETIEACWANFRKESK